MLNKYYVTLSLVIDAVSHEHAEEIARQLAPSCGKVTTHLIGSTSRQVATPLVLNDFNGQETHAEVGDEEVELRIQLPRREAALLFDLCALQHETLQNAAMVEGAGEYRAELEVLQKVLDSMSDALHKSAEE